MSALCLWATRLLCTWDVFKGQQMYEHNYNEWVADINALKISGKTIEFKFVAVDVADTAEILWEDRFNRTIDVPVMEKDDIMVYELDDAFFPIYNIRCAGTQVPVFSLRSRSSFGVGDFGDLKKMIDWVA